jgi:hypothetical protein
MAANPATDKGYGDLHNFDLEGHGGHKFVRVEESWGADPTGYPFLSHTVRIDRPITPTTFVLPPPADSTIGMFRSTCVWDGIQECLFSVPAGMDLTINGVVDGSFLLQPDVDLLPGEVRPALLSISSHLEGYTINMVEEKADPAPSEVRSFGDWDVVIAAAAPAAVATIPGGFFKEDGSSMAQGRIVSRRGTTANEDSTMNITLGGVMIGGVANSKSWVVPSNTASGQNWFWELKWRLHYVEVIPAVIGSYTFTICNNGDETWRNFGLIGGNGTPVLDQPATVTVGRVGGSDPGIVYLSNDWEYVIKKEV